MDAASKSGVAAMAFIGALWLCDLAAAISERTDTRATLEGGTAASMCCCPCLLVAKISVRDLLL
jgi:hypothetical protein